MTIYRYAFERSLGNIGLISDNSLCSEIVNDISNLGSVSSNWNSRNGKDYDKNSSELRLVLKNLKLKNNHRLVIGNLNINSISNKSDNLKLITQGKIDILVITETKTDSTFPLNQFAYKVIRNLTGLIEIEIEVVFLYMFKKIFQVGN